MSMDEDELDAIRRKKLAELQQYQTQAVAEQQYREQVQAQRQLILRQILTPEARERLGRIELAYPELKENIENQLIQLAQSGRVKSMIDDATLRQILERDRKSTRLNSSHQIISYAVFCLKKKK